MTSRSVTTLLTLLTIGILLPQSAQAEPRFAVRKGASCSMCHVNPTGGGMRNAYGRSVFELHQLDSGVGSDVRFDPQVTDGFTFGGDFRLAYIGQPKRLGDKEYRQVPAGLFTKTPTLHTFFPMQADLYFCAEIGQHVTLYTDLGAQGSFEVFGLLKDLPGGSYVKAGFFNPAYGTKLPNHTAAVRQASGFDPRGKDAGIELGVQQPWIDFQVAVHNGDTAGSPIDLNKGKSYSSRIAGILNTDMIKAHVGASILRTESFENVENDDGSTREAVAIETRTGPFLWIAAGRFAWLGELLLRTVSDGTTLNDSGGPTESGLLTSYQELNFLIANGVNVGGTYEFMDRDTKTSVRGKPDVVHRYGGLVNWFPVPYVELNLIMRSYLARADTEENGQWEAVGFLHLFF